MPAKLLDLERWKSEIKKPFWYIQLVPEFQELMELRHTNETEYERAKETVYSFFENHLLNQTVALGTTGEDWDRERKPIDTVVIHHTSNPPGMRLSRLSAIELIRLYAPQYVKKEIPQEIYSGHFQDGKQIFYPYHWFVREDGTVEHLLSDRPSRGNGR